jgi:hypothetical protein
MPGCEGAVLLPVGTCCEESASFGSPSGVPATFGCRTGCGGVDWFESTLSVEPNAFERRLCKLESVRGTPTAANREYRS